MGVEDQRLTLPPRGAFKKTLREQKHKIRVLFQHRRDPLIGEKPLGAIEYLAEDARGAAHEVSLLNTAYVRELLPALEAGLYGASFRFLPLRPSHNPQALPEVTVTEASVSEFGPVTFRAYATATAGLRCCALTDELAFATLADGRKLDQLEAWTEPSSALVTPSESLPGPRCQSRCGAWRTTQTSCRTGPSPTGTATRSREGRMISA